MVQPDILQTEIDQLNDKALSLYEDDIARARSLSDEARRLAASMEPRYDLGYARALAIEIEWQHQKGNYVDVIKLATEILSLYGDFPPDDWLLITLYATGGAYADLGEYTLALRMYQQLLADARQLNNITSQATALRRIGVVHHFQSKWSRAKEYYQQSLDLFTLLDSQPGMAGVLNNLALIAKEEDDLDTALQLGNEALALFEKSQYVRGQVTTHLSLSEVYRHMGDLDAASEHNREALHLVQDLNAYDLLINSLLEQGKLLLIKQVFDEAKESITETLQLAREKHDRRGEVSCVALLAELHEQLGDYQLALGFFRQYHDLEQEMVERASQQRFENLEVLHRTQEAQHQAEIYRIRNEALERHNQMAEQAIEELEGFSHSVSHDLRGPVRTILGFSTLLLNKYGDQLNEECRDYLGRIQVAGNRMRELIEGLLTLSRMKRHELKRESVNLSTVAQGIVERLIEEEPERHVDIEIAQDVVVEGDVSLLTIVLDNLFNNAWKYTAHREKAHIELGVDVEDGHIYIHDNGIGFDIKHAERLFQPFERLDNAAEYEGSGIGLVTVQRIIERHGGRIWADAEVDKGATFRFTI